MSRAEGSDPGNSGTHSSDTVSCGGTVKDSACSGCGADGIHSSNVKGAQ